MSFEPLLTQDEVSALLGVAASTLEKMRMRGAWLQICRLAGIKDASPYCTRHTFVSRGSRAGVGIEGSSDLVGHATLETTKRIYHHGEDAMHQKNIAAMEADLDTVIGGDN